MHHGFVTFAVLATLFPQETLMIKKQLLILIAMAVVLALVACASPTAIGTTQPSFSDQAATVDAATVQALPSKTPEPAAKPTCPEPMEGTQLLMNEEHGYCLLHPTEYNVLFPPMETCLATVVNSMECQFVTFAMTDTSTSAWINVDQASGRTAGEVADAEIAALGSDFNIERTDLTIDGEQAVLMDGLPGQDIVRRLVVVHNDLLYTLTFMPWDQDDTALVNLYTTIVDSLHFLPVDLKPMATKTMLPAGFQLSFVSPVDGQEIDLEHTYFFQVADIVGAQAYQWTFSQNGVVVWDNLRDDLGLTGGGTYEILEGSPAHAKFHPGEVEVAVRALMVGDYYTDPTVITVILRPKEATPAPP
jgi:hypothetical protein